MQRTQFVGETEKTLAVRFSQHRGYARNGKVDTATGNHFNLRAHSMANSSNDPQHEEDPRVFLHQKIQLKKQRNEKTKS